MGGLFKGCVVLALIWSGWWWLAATLVERQVSQWFAARQAEGWQADVGTLNVTGFPAVLNAQITDIAVQGPVEQVSAEAAELEMLMPAYWPGDITLRLPETPLKIANSAGTYFLRATDGLAALETHPGLSLQLESLSAMASAWEVNTPQGNLLNGTDLTATFRQDAEQDTLYRLSIGATDFAPGDLLRSTLAIPAVWPDVFEALSLAAEVSFDTPLDRTAQNHTQPQPRSFTLDTLDLRWYEIALRGSGAVAIDASGTPEGDLRLVVDGWQTLLAQAKRSGTVPTARMLQWELTFNAIANLGDRSETLEIDLRFADGQAFLGPISLGPAPRIQIPY